MRRLVAALLLVAAPAFAQENGWQEIQNGWGEIQTATGSYATMTAPSGCVAGSVGFFLGTPVVMSCDAGLTYAVATDVLAVASGKVTAANLTASGLATPGGITVVPTLSQIGAITAVAGSALADGDALSVGDGTGIVPMEFDAAPGDGTTGGAIAIIFDGTETATEIRDAIKAILDTAGRDWTTSNQGADGIGIVRATPGATGGAITEAVTDAGFLVTDWTDPTHATTVTYQLVACLADGSCTQAGADSTTGTSVAMLTASNLNRLTWSEVTGAASYKVYRKVAPTSPATVGVIYTGTGLTFDDTGIAGGGETAPFINTTGTVRGLDGQNTNLVNVTADQTLLLGAASSALISNFNSSGTVTITLPASAPLGYRVQFVTSSQVLKIKAPSGEQMRRTTHTGACMTSTGFSFAEVVKWYSTQWVATMYSGTWTPGGC